MKKDSSRYLFAIMVLLGIAIYSFILFMVKTQWDIAAWMIYGFTLLAFLMLIVDMYIPSNGAVRYPMFDSSLSAAAIGYFIVQLLGGIVALCASGLNPLYTLIAEVVLFLLYLFVGFGLSLGREITQGQDASDSAKIAVIRLMKADLDAIAAQADDAALQKSIRSLAETAGYSDPMSDEALGALEERIRSNIAMLREDVDESNAEKAQIRIEKLRRLFDERTARCLALKRGG